MSTKLPFSAGGLASEMSARVVAGLVPSMSNKTKALSKEQELLYRQVLQSETKDFKLILGEQDDLDSLNSSLPQVEVSPHKHSTERPEHHQAISMQV